MKQSIDEFILAHEARFDKNGHLTVYQLPVGDKGGTYEVAGICNRYHPVEAAALKTMIEAGEYEKAHQTVLFFIGKTIGPVMQLHDDDRVNWFMADLCYNRGEVGAKKIAQHALKGALLYSAPIDGVWGRMSQQGFDDPLLSPEELVFRLFASWMWYERTVMGRDETHPFWRGLMNRRIDLLRFVLDV